MTVLRRSVAVGSGACSTVGQLSGFSTGSGTVVTGEGSGAGGVVSTGADISLGTLGGSVTESGSGCELCGWTLSSGVAGVWSSSSGI